ncbi:MAG: hypothetical protein GX053_06400 [Tissierella sp.]|nr:hypothetical protein [Tissierella sp.]
MKKFILFLTLMALLIPIGSTAEIKYDEQKVLSTIMDDLEAEIKEEDIIFNGVIINKFIKEDEMSSVAEEIKNKIGLLGIEIDPLIKGNYNDDYYTKEVIFEDGFGQICYIGQDKDKNNIAIILSSYYTQEELIGETYLYVNIVKSSDFLKNNGIIEEVKSIYSNYNCRVEISSCLIGEISNDMSYNDRVKEIGKTLKKIDGKVIEEFSDTSLISYTVYTPYIDKYIKIDKDRINLNIAIRNSELDNKNYIWLGTPIITVGY